MADMEDVSVKKNKIKNERFFCLTEGNVGQMGKLRLQACEGRVRGAGHG